MFSNFLPFNCEPFIIIFLVSVKFEPLFRSYPLNPLSIYQLKYILTCFLYICLNLIRHFLFFLSSHKLTRLHIHVLCMFTTPLMKLYFTLFNTKLTFYYWHDKQNKRKKRENKCLNKKRNIYWLGIMNNRQQILWILKKNLLF